jgi:hypothetical protein
MQRKEPEITNNETIPLLTFRAHFKISALLFPSSGNHRMIHKKGGRIRTYGLKAPDLIRTKLLMTKQGHQQPTFSSESSTITTGSNLLGVGASKQAEARTERAREQAEARTERARERLESRVSACSFLACSTGAWR